MSGTNDGAYGGTDGTNVNVGSTSDDDMTDYSGGFSIQNTAGQVGGVSIGGQIAGALEAVGSSAIAIAAQLFGAPAAQASSYMIVSSTGQIIGWSVIPGLTPGVSLIHQIDIMLGMAVSSVGLITMNGVPAGFVDLGSAGHAGPIEIGPLNINEMTVDADPNGVTANFEGLNGEITGLIDHATGATYTFKNPQNPRVMPLAICTPSGIPIKSQGIAAMDAGLVSYLNKNRIWGKDGIYSLISGKRLAPKQGLYGPTKGFSVGPAATYAVNYLYYVFSGASGYGCFTGGPQPGGSPLNNTWDPITCIDPTTGKVLVPTGYVLVWGCDGSQLIAQQGANIAPATALNPCYNTSLGKIIGVHPTIKNPAFCTLAQAQAMQPGFNFGGGELGVGGQ